MPHWRRCRDQIFNRNCRAAGRPSRLCFTAQGDKSLQPSLVAAGGVASSRGHTPSAGTRHRPTLTRRPRATVRCPEDRRRSFLRRSRHGDRRRRIPRALPQLHALAARSDEGCSTSEATVYQTLVSVPGLIRRSRRYLRLIDQPSRLWFHAREGNAMKPHRLIHRMKDRRERH
jgi:hypothetical protein